MTPQDDPLSAIYHFENEPRWGLIDPSAGRRMRLHPRDSDGVICEGLEVLGPDRAIAWRTGWVWVFLGPVEVSPTRRDARP